MLAAVAVTVAVAAAAVVVAMETVTIRTIHIMMVIYKSIFHQGIFCLKLVAHAMARYNKIQSNDVEKPYRTIAVRYLNFSPNFLFYGTVFFLSQIEWQTVDTVTVAVMDSKISP